MVGSIDWLRWLFYLLAGVPLFGWLFFTRSRTLRTVGVLFITFFVQDALAGRRYVFGFSLGPSLAAAYAGLIAVTLEQRRAPQPGFYGGLVLGLVFCALVGILLGSNDRLTLQLNLKQLQFNFIEGLVFFFFAIAALRNGAELVRFFHWFVGVGLLTALAHLFTIGTGYRFRGTGSSDVADHALAGILGNPNSLGSFFAMCIPVTLAISMKPHTRQSMRMLCYASMVVMTASLMLSGSRGGMIFSLIGCGVAAYYARVGLARIAAGVLGAAVLGGIGFQAMRMLLGGSWARVLKGLQEEGLETNRWVTFQGYLRAIAANPLGVGLTPYDFERAAAKVGMYGVASAHNIYLDMALQCGVLGLALFLGVIVSVLIRNRRAFRLADNAADRDGLTYVFIALLSYAMVGFFEPIYTADSKLNNLFWLLTGLCAGASARVFQARRSQESAFGDRSGQPIAVASHAQHF